MPRTRAQPLSIYLRRPGNDSLKSWLRDPDSGKHLAMSLGTASNGLMVAKPSRPHPPDWLDFISPGLAKDKRSLPTMTQASASAILLLAVGGRHFGFSFGQGHHLLKDEQCVHDFGLKVVLNAVDVEQLKSVGIKSIDESSLRTKRDASRGSSIGTFGLDPISDLLREVAGVPRDTSQITRLAGSVSLAVAARVDVFGLPSLAERLLKLYLDDTYRKEFEWLDHFRPIQDQDKIRRLDQQLVSDLNAGDLTYAHLAPPHQLEWEHVEGFTFSTIRGRKDLMPDPRISRYLETVPTGGLTIDRINSDRLQVYDGPSGQPRYSWSMHRCIVYEHREKENRFVLSEGQWYEVDGAFAKRVARYVRNMSKLKVALPTSVIDEKENAYNKRAAQVIGAVCTDGKLVSGAAFDRVELCDLFTRHRQLIHVKRRSGSSTLSHLFAQGVVSAELLCDEDSGFRKAVRKKLRALAGPPFANIVPEGRPDTSKFEVGYVILTRGHQSNRNPYTLPFFSMVSLMNASKRLRALNFKVSVLAVSEQQAAP